MSEAGVLVVIEIAAVRDADALKRYQMGARDQIARFGGSVLARGGSTFEGAPFGPVLVQRWPSQAAFAAWQDSAEYQPLRALRQSCADLRIAIVPLV